MIESTWEVLVLNTRVKLMPACVILLSFGCGGGDVTTPTSGSLEITTSTSGPNPDQDGYTVEIDGGAATAISINGTLGREDLVPGSHTILLAGLELNCTVEGDNPRTVGVTAAQVTRVTFTVSCTTPPPSTGILIVTTTTTGPKPDPDGYTLMVDTGSPQGIGVNATLTVENLSAGSHTVTLAGLASNCRVEGENPRTVLVTTGTDVEVALAITCTQTQGSKILFLSYRDGAGDIFTMNTDGSQQTNLTRSVEGVLTGSWSPDGRRVAFMSYHGDFDDDLQVINPDGSGATNLTGAVQFYLLAPIQWSPDGSKIAFAALSDDVSPDDIYIINADGTQLTRLVDGGDNDPETEEPSSDANQPSWSPDGSQIAFTSYGGRGRGIFIMNPDGSGQRPLTSGNDTDASWSPDGRKIAFIRTTRSNVSGRPLFADNVWVMNSDGSRPLGLTRFSVEDELELRMSRPSWSPDGSRVTFAGHHTVNPDRIYLAPADGNGLTVLASAGENNNYVRLSGARWSPDGTHILFSASLGGSNFDIFVMNTDGSSVTNLTNHPSHDSDGQWQP
jgi:Tol biopolymer transport system component